MKYLLLIGLLLSLISTTYAGDYYSNMKYLDKETCQGAARIGQTKGIRDRSVGIKDNNKFDFAYRVCKDCDSGIKVELATCYEAGYNMGYYNRY